MEGGFDSFDESGTAWKAEHHLSLTHSVFWLLQKRRKKESRYVPLANIPQPTALHGGGYKVASVVTNCQVAPLDCKAPGVANYADGFAWNCPS